MHPFKLLVLTGIVPVLAVKDYLFRKCDQNPFCHRNRHYAVEAQRPDFVTPYTLANLDTADPAHITGTLVKSVGDQTVDLSLLIEIKTDNTVHFVVDEPNRKLDNPALQASRYSPAGDILDHSQVSKLKPTKNVKVSKKDGAVTISFGDGNEVEITLSPFKARLLHKGTEQVALNNRQLLNFEQLRKKDSNDGWNSWELQDNAWSDSFDGKTDEKSRGPEAVALDIDFSNYKHVFGIPEHADSLSLKETNSESGHSEPYRLFNVDIFEYETQSPMPMYGSIPFMMASKTDSATGVFWLNGADTYVDVSKSSQGVGSHWISEAGKLDFYLFVDDKPAHVLEAYGKLTGMAALPQAFAIGYHQCRWNYNSQSDVLEVNANFDEASLPYDVIWLDVEYTDAKKYFTWNKDQFPEPVEMLGELDETKRKLVTIIDPHIKAEKSYFVYDDLVNKNFAVQDRANKPYEGHCWPGNSVWVDSMNPAASEYWASLYAFGNDLGGDALNLHIWNDMNEPSVFSGPETTAPKYLLHHGGWEHRDLHNVYGQTLTNRTFDGMLSRYNGEQRPFILTRSYYAGSQRIAAMWTGDNQADWAYLKEATPMILTSGIAGMPFSGADVGGFFNNPDSELLTRWYQAGAFYPFFRGHAHIDSARREPYLAEEPYKSAISNALHLRYQLLPQFYSAFYEASQTLAPVMRPLFFEFPEEEAVYAIDDEFLIGDSLLAKPVVDRGAKSIDVVLPGGGVYYDYFTGKAHRANKITVPTELESIPLFVRGGKIITRRDRHRRSAELMANDPYTLVVAVDDSGRASGKLYTDDGISYGYEKGHYALAEFVYESGQLKNKVTHADKAFNDLNIERIIVYGAQASTAHAGKTKFDLEQTDAGFIVRNPRFKIAENWTLTFK
ncbi:Glucosidase 2 subunit alpha [Wickerhamiella sorbophila]|uniref:Glucosidase II subunit alpha n=1 Tax=Wickerhamiella sorbophila TaxID=45607 RepID=A0A2T0FKY5_9ASCO|nr:Glucosidase 2 subunit alpha [Wickerhamiella sorbophila]PRT55651.1 Glucosidase 2 subunit alpha [Wickerhamiella sorbophila]